MFGKHRRGQWSAWVAVAAAMLLLGAFAGKVRAACDLGDYTVGGSCPSTTGGVDIALSCSDDCCTFDACDPNYYTAYSKIYKKLYDGTQVPVIYGRGDFLYYVWQDPCGCVLT